MTSAEAAPAASPPFFARSSVVRRVDGDGALLLGGGRALLLQLAHPGVAQGVADHSAFRTDPLGRLVGTLNAMFGIVFGTEADAERIGRGLDRVHDRVVGPGYAANDPTLKLWVHATLVDTALRVHRRFLAPLRPDEEEAYYQGSKRVAEALGVPIDLQPPDLASFRAYVRTMVATLEVSDAARDVAGAVLRPDLPWPAQPLAGLVREVTVGMTPAPLRAGYGLRWDPAREAALQAAGAWSRATVGRLPAAVRRVPGAWRAA